MSLTVRCARRVLAALVSMSLAVVGLLALTVVSPVAAEAAPAPIQQRSPETVTADALPTVQIDGVAWDQVIVGNTVYVGGQFSNARPAGAAPGTSLTPRSNLLAYDIRTGVLISSFAPTLNGQVKGVAASPDGSRLYVVGQFTTVNGSNRYRIAAFDTATGALVSNFAPASNGVVNSVTVTPTAVYVGGAFTKMGTVDRMRLAAFSPANGALLSWAPVADSRINAILATPDRSRVIAAGAFSTVNGSTAQGLASIDATTGALLPFAANNVVRDYGETAAMLSLSTDGTTIYSTGYWFGGTGNFEGVLAADPTTGNIKWLADCHGDTYDASAGNGVVYAVSHWHHCENIGGFPDTNPRDTWHRANAMTADVRGTVANNNQGGYYNYAGYGAPALVNWLPTVPAGTFTGQSQGGWTSEANRQYVVQGGEFPSVNGTAQQGLVRFAVPSLAPKKQGPRVSGAAANPSLLAVRANTVRVTWKTNWDRDDQDLTYSVFRGGTTLPLYTTTSASQFWNRPSLSWSDTSVVAGGTYRYRIQAADADGNVTLSEFVTITVPAQVSPYLGQVIDDGATSYWRMNGTSNQVDYAGNSPLTGDPGVTAGGTGAIQDDTDTAAAFSGTDNGVADTSVAITGPTTFSAEAWVKTTSTSGGKIIGFGNTTSGQSGSYDRHVYMTNNGQIVFGVYPNAVRTVSGPKSYNDDKWHHVVAQLSPAGMVLYIDGFKVGADTSVTGAQEYGGYWRVGGDNLNGWPNQPSSSFFNGTIDEVAIYPSALTVAQVRDHYTKSGRTVDLPAGPADNYGKAVVADEPALFWRFDETTETNAADASNNSVQGIVAGGVTKGAASSVTAANKSYSFNGGDGTVGSSTAIEGPRTYSEEVWFRTTTTGGGKLIGFGNNQSGFSNNYDRHLYMENDGRLTFGVWTGQANTTTSPQSYNNGEWHQAVVTQSAGGMKLYVDSQLVGTNPQTDAQPYGGYWRVGGDTSWCCNSFFNGDLDEAAIYLSELSAERVRAHYVASPAAINAAPQAAFTETCTDGSCAFDGRGSSDPDGSIASYAWEFSPGETATGAQATHTFTASGTYAVKLTVTDNQGKTGSTSKDVTVTVPAGNVLPTADFTASCTERACAFDSSASTDSDGTITSRVWDFGDDGTSTEANPSHTYAANGTYQVKLTVTDNRGGTDSLTKAVTVRKNAAPVAAFAVDCDQLACSFDGTGSTDDRTVDSYLWNFGDSKSATGATPEHTYDEAGTYTVVLTVTDDEGLTDTESKSVTVTVSPPNQAPVAAFTSSVSGLTASFDASGSTDSDGTIASYAWKFGDGTTATGVRPSKTYAGSGSYNVELTVTDDDGATTAVTKAVAVTAGPVIADDFNRSVTRWGNANTGGTWTYSGSTFATDGQRGTIRLATAGAGATASLPVSQRDVDVVADVSVDKMATGAGTYTTFITRKVGTSDYRLTFRELPAGAIKLTIARTVNGTATNLRDIAISGITYQAGDVMRVRFTVSGNGTTTLAGKVWKRGTAEPAAAQASATDTTSELQGAGSFGIFGYLSGSSTNAPVTIGIDNLSVTTP